MNPLDWGGTFRSQQRNLDWAHQTVVDSSMENASAADNYWDTRCNYPRYTVDEPQSMPPGVSLGSKGLCPPLHNSHDQEVDLEDPSGNPFEMDEDPELRRKREQLREIEEQIICKKVSIALKAVKPLAEESSLTGFSSNEQSATCKGATLKDRVNAIIQQRHPVSFLSKVHCRRDKMCSSSLSKDGLLQEDHPLKLRVKALMMQRCRDPHVLSTNIKVPGVTPPPPSQIVTSPAEGENSVHQGFQRFLSVLNKGVDMDLLSRIVNDDSEDLPLGEERLNIQTLAVENMSDPPLRGESLHSNSAFQLGHSRSNSRESKTDLPRQDRYLNDHVPEDDEQKNDRGVLCLGASSRSKSPPPVKKKRKKIDEEKPNVGKQHADLQNILKTLGFSLEVEEMSKLADRTQERLYGKKHEGVRDDSRGEHEGQQRDSHGQQRSSFSSSSFSSSSSSSSSSSRSTSRSVSPSPPRHRRSHSRDWEQRRTPEHSSWRDRSRDRVTYNESKQDSKEAQKHRDGEDSKETSTYQHPYLQNHMYPHSVALSSYPDYRSSQFSQYFDSGTHNAATDAYWTYTQDAIPPSLYPTEHPFPQNTCQHFPSSVSTPTKALPRQKPLRDVNLLMNPDLSKSEGQTGSTSGPRCLTVIPTKQLTHQICLKQLTSHRPRRRNRPQKNKRRRRRVKEKLRLANSVKKGRGPQGAEDGSNSKPEAEQTEEERKQPTKQSQEEKEEPAEQSEEEKKQPTEEEIKMNLRKKLEAFNQMVKQKLTQSAL